MNDPTYTYHRFVVSTLRRQSTAWLRFKLVVSGILAIGSVVVAVPIAIELHTERAVMEASDKVDRPSVILVLLGVAPFCAIHAYRIQIALRRQKERRALSA